MTVLDDVKSFCYRINIPAPSSLVSQTAPGTLQILHILYAVCEELRQAACWTQQKRTYTFETESGRSQYTLPQDFYSLLPDTQWNEDQNLQLMGPALDSDFTYELYGIGGTGSEFTFRIFGFDSNPNTGQGQFQVTPTPGSTAQSLRFEYLTKNLFLPKNWAPLTGYTSGVYVNVSGNIYLCDTNGTSSSTAPTALTQNITDGSTRWDYVATPYESIVLDTDLNLFDSDLVKLGLRAKWFEDKGEEFNPAMDEFNSKIEQAKVRFHGTKTGSMIRKVILPRYSVQYRGWTF